MWTFDCARWKTRFEEITAYLQAFLCIIIVIIICDHTFTNVLYLWELKRATEQKDTKTPAILTYLCMHQITRLQTHTAHDKHKLCSKKSRRPALNWIHIFISKFSPEWVYFDALSRHSPWQTRCSLCIYFSPDWWLMPSSSRYESTQGGSPGSAAARRNATVGVSACWESEQQSTLGGRRGVRR